MQKFSYFLNVALAIGLFCVVFKYECKPEYKDKPFVIDIVDSNAIYDQIDSEDGGKIIILYDSIEILNKRLKTVKTVFKYKYQEILKDTTLVDSNCLITLDYANETINQMDSLINIQSRGLDACNSQVINLRGQVKYNQDLKTEYQSLYKETAAENEKLDRKVKRNRLFAGIVSAMLFSFVLIK
jgi:hypothetical protein